MPVHFQRLGVRLQHDLDLSVDMPVLESDGGESYAHLLSGSYHIQFEQLLDFFVFSNDNNSL